MSAPRSSALWITLILLGAIVPAQAAPAVSTILPAATSTVGTLTSISVTFTEAVSGIDASDLEINQSGASDVSGSGSGPYVFTFTQPPSGTVSVEWTEDHGIVGLGTGAFVPTGAWSYTLTDNVAPIIAPVPTSVPGQEIKHILPAPASTVSSLTQTTIYFSEPVTGVDAADLIINGVPATTLTGSEAGPYVFTFAAPGNAAVNFTWQSATGIVDASGNAFAGYNWSVTKVASLGTVVISEFLAANGGASANTVNGTRDEDFDLSPWIELYNPGATSIDLTGWSLTNDPGDPDLWILPARTLAAGARLIVWASGKDRKPSSGHLHANFTTDISGGYLALHNANHPRGAAVSSYPANYPTVAAYPPQRYDYSYGMQSGDGALRYFTPPSVNQTAYTLPTSGNPSPTPPAEPQGAANAASTLTGLTPNPTSSVNRGFFTSPFSVILSCEQAGAVIRYTTNGSVPLATDTAYTTPIFISGTTVLRFAAFGPNSVPSETVTQTYLFADDVIHQNSPPYIGTNTAPVVGNQTLPLSWGTQSGFGFPGLITNLAANQIPADYGMDAKIHADPNTYADDGTLSPTGKTNLQRIHDGLRSMPVLSVVMKNDDMFSAGGLYPTSSASNKTDNTKPCSVEMFEADGTSVFHSDAGIDNHGNASRDPNKTPKHGYTLRFKGRYGNSRLQAAVFPDSPVNEWDKLVLRADYGFTWLHWDGSIQRKRGIRIRDPFCKDSFRDMGRMDGHSRFVNLFINGIYWGTFDIAEDEAQDFAASYFGGDKAGYDVVEQNVLKNGSWTAYREIKRILGWTSAPNYNTAPSATKLASAFTNANYEEIKQYLDVPWHCDYMILHYYIGHEDWGTQAAYDKNWYAVREPGGKFKYLPWDMENTMDSETINRVTGATYPPTAIQPRLNKNAQYLLDFADRVNVHMVNPDGALLPAASIARLDRWTSIMNPDAMCLESARWGDYRDRVHVYTSDSNVIYTWNGSWYENGARTTNTTNWLTEINRLKNTYFPVRTGNVLTQFRNAGLYPLLNAPEFLNAADNTPAGSLRVSAGFQLKMQLPVSPPSGTTNTGTIYYTTDGSDPRVYYDTTGSRTPTAQAYAAPLTILSTATVKARTLNGTTWSALRESTYTVGSTLPRVVISEIHYRPSSAGTSREFIEILNAGSQEVDVSQWTLDGVSFIFPFGSSLAPGSRIVLANGDNPSAFAAAYPGVVVFGYYGGSLDNGDERLILFDRGGNIVSTVHYYDQFPWPSTPDGGGPSLELIRPLGDTDSAANWQPSAANHGTPGQPNGAPATDTLVLSEIGAASGFIEVTNASAANVSTAGWSLRILQSGNTYASIVLPATTLTPGTFLSVNSPLDSQHGHILLLDATGKTRDGIRYGPQAAGCTFSRVSGSWILTQPTPGASNISTATASPTNLRINEFLADPVPGQEDWLEISNPSAQPADLTNLQVRANGRLQAITQSAAIAPFSYARIFCDSTSMRGDTLPLVIPAEGGTLALQKADGTVMDTVTYTRQSPDVSSGRLPDTTGAFTPLPYASPAAPNHNLLANIPRINEVLVKNHHGDINPWAKRSAWFELRNPTPSPVTLTDWRVRGIGDITQAWMFPAGTSIPSNGHLVIWADPTSAVSTSPGGQLNCGIAIDSETTHDYSAWGLELVTASGQIADRITWGIQVPDQSIGRNSTDTWTLLAQPTRGTTNTAGALFTTAGGIRINEWASRDIALGTSILHPFFELFNPASSPVNLSSLWLGDEPSESGTRKWRFPPLSFIGAGSHALLLPSTGGNDPARVSFNLASGGEMLVLSDASATVDSVNFGLGLTTNSQGRAPDGGALIAPLLPTPGSTNVAAGSGFPVFYLHPRSQSVAAGGSHILTAEASPANSYQWYRNGSAIPGATSSILPLGPLTSSHNGIYRCVATNGNGSTESQPATLDVLYSYALLAAEKSLGPADADDDGDGTSNGIELLAGTDPLTADHSPYSMSLESQSGNLYLGYTLKLNSRAAYSSLTGELGPNLHEWSPALPAQSDVLATDPNGDPTVRMLFLVPPNQQNHFLHLRMEP